MDGTICQYRTVEVEIRLTTYSLQDAFVDCLAYVLKVTISDQTAVLKSRKAGALKKQLLAAWYIETQFMKPINYQGNLFEKRWLFFFVF